MRTATRIAEGLSGVLLLGIGLLANPHMAVVQLIVGVLGAAAAFFISWSFPTRLTPQVAFLLAIVAFIAAFTGGLGERSSSGSGLHSPIAAFEFSPIPFLLLAQIVSAIGAFKAIDDESDADTLHIRKR